MITLCRDVNEKMAAPKFGTAIFYDDGNRGLYCLYDVSIVFVQILHQIGDAVVVLEFFRMIL